MAGQRIVANSVLPACREELRLTTADGLRLVGEAAFPVEGMPAASIVTVHPLPTHGGMMDSHVLRKMAWRLPALADIAVVRFNTRGTTSAAGTSEGGFDQARGEGLDLKAAIDEVLRRGWPAPWLVGWSFGTDVILKHGDVDPVRGAILLSPPLRFSVDDDLDRWAVSGRPLICLVPEFDDYLVPDEARRRFARIPQAQVRGIEGAKHLWVGERHVSRVLDEIVAVVRPDVGPLPDHWDGPMERWSDL
ncbi:MAG TPA: alpha/beta hydrolase [Actinobacteria bacterium]|jgi:alpha/beta superfamily hydrolase|nr:alpha/beta hydrolase [Actinomycetota bacterium]